MRALSKQLGGDSKDMGNDCLIALLLVFCFFILSWTTIKLMFDLSRTRFGNHTGENFELSVICLKLYYLFHMQLHWYVFKSKSSIVNSNYTIIINVKWR